jgi:hypothetical protein
MGDRSIQSRAGEGFGGLHVDTLDANTARTESFSEPRTVDGQTVFVTPEGAQALDLAADRSWKVHVNGTTWQRLRAAIDEWRAGR